MSKSLEEMLDELAEKYVVVTVIDPDESEVFLYNSYGDFSFKRGAAHYVDGLTLTEAVHKLYERVMK